MDEEQLVQGLRSQTPGAVQELVVSHGDRWFRSACLLCGNQAEAQDLVQETLLQAVRSKAPQDRRARSATPYPATYRHSENCRALVVNACGLVVFG